MPKRAIKPGKPVQETAFRTGEPASTSAPAHVVVLAYDEALLELLAQTLEGRQRIWRADGALHAADLVVASQDSVLFLDVAVTTHETPALVERLHAQFPELPIIVTGRRDDETELGALISSGAIFRFLHKPVSVERIRTFIDAAERRRSEQRLAQPPPSREPSGFALPDLSLRRLAPDAATVRRLLRSATLLVVLLAFLLLIGEALRRRPWEGLELPGLLLPGVSPPAAQHTAGTAAPVSPPTPGAEGTADAPAALATRRAMPGGGVGRLLSLAAIALTQGRLVEPEGQNAVELYRRVLLKDPDNAEALDGLGRAADELLAAVEQALLAGDLPAAASALDAARSADPGNPRLEFLSAQLTREREIGAASERRAASGIAAAASAVRAEVARLLSVADTRMREGKLVGGADSAEAYVLAARRARPRDPAVRQALNALSGRMLLAGSQALVEGDVAGASVWLDRADALGVDSRAVTRLRAEIESQRLASVREDQSRLLALASQRIAQGRLLDPEADSARHYLDLLQAAAPDYPGLGETESMLAERLADGARALLAAGRTGEAARLLAAADAAGAPPAMLAPLSAQLDRAAALSGTAGPALPESSLKRVVHRPPTYPARAAARGVEGWAQIEFIVRRDGTTGDAQITGSSPEGYFEESVLEAVADWRYEPQLVDGRPVERRVVARLRFKLQDR